MESTTTMRRREMTENPDGKSIQHGLRCTMRGAATCRRGAGRLGTRAHSHRAGFLAKTRVKLDTGKFK